MALTLALLLDALFGEPRWLWERLPHPAVLMGRIIGWADGRFNSGNMRRLSGALVIAGLVAVSIAAGSALQALPTILPEIILGAILLAQKSLVDHVRAVARALRLSTGDGRMAVSMIVGRDTGEMDGPAISRAAIESAAENLSDGVVAPAFWFALGGLPGLLAYKITNTADSMIGYRTPRHEAFGWAAARLDDLLNWIPARLTALLIWVVSGARSSLSQVASDARKHRSPNAGWPEAAMAPALGVALSGPRSYEGRLKEFPWVNEAGRKDAGPDDIDEATMVLWKSWALLTCLAALLALL